MNVQHDTELNSTDEDIQRKSKGNEKKTYTCDVCLKEFKRKDILTRHKYSHLWSKPYSCEICSKAFARTDNLKKHIKTHNRDDDDNHSADVFKKSLKISRVHQCKFCSKEFSRRDRFNEHLTTHQGGKKPQFSCEICSKSFSRIDNMNRHLKKHSAGENLSKKNLPSASEVELYPIDQKLNENDFCAIDDQPGKIHECDVCFKTFARKDGLKKHSIIHSGIKPFCCEICSKAFGRRDHLKKHLRSHPEY